MRYFHLLQFNATTPAHYDTHEMYTIIVIYKYTHIHITRARGGCIIHNMHSRDSRCVHRA
jgi:hypothetical protein